MCLVGTRVLSLSSDVGEDVPQLSPGPRVHAGGWLIKQNDSRAAHQCYGRTQLALVASTAHTNICDLRKKITDRHEAMLVQTLPCVARILTLSAWSCFVLSGSRWLFLNIDTDRREEKRPRESKLCIVFSILSFCLIYSQVKM